MDEVTKKLEELKDKIGSIYNNIKEIDEQINITETDSNKYLMELGQINDNLQIKETNHEKVVENCLEQIYEKEQILSELGKNKLYIGNVSITTFLTIVWTEYIWCVTIDYIFFKL